MMLCGIYNWRSSPNLLGLSVFQRLAITNMNQSYPACVQQYVTLNSPRVLNCTAGAMQKLYSYGIVSSDTPSNNLTQCPSIADLPSSSSIYKCSTSALNSLGFQNDFNSNCMGQVSCSMNFSNYIINTTSTSSYCVTNPARFYVQYYCELSQDNTQHNRKVAFFNSVIAVLNAAIFLVALYLYQRYLKESKFRITKDLVYPAAFTGKFILSEQLWYQVLQRYRIQPTWVSPQIMLIKCIEQFYELNRPVDALPGSNYKVACVKIEFNNYEVIQLLQQKATHLYWGRVD